MTTSPMTRKDLGEAMDKVISWSCGDVVKLLALRLIAEIYRLRHRVRMQGLQIRYLKAGIQVPSAIEKAGLRPPGLDDLIDALRAVIADGKLPGISDLEDAGDYDLDGAPIVTLLQPGGVPCFRLTVKNP